MSAQKIKSDLQYPNVYQIIKYLKSTLILINPCLCQKDVHNVQILSLKVRLFTCDFLL